MARLRPTAARPTAARPTAARPTAARPTAARPTAARPTAARPTAARPTAARPTAARPTAAARRAARLLLALALVLGILSGAVPTRADDAEPLVADTTAPMLAQPADLLVAAVDASGGDVAFPLPDAVDETDPDPDVSCAPASGARFPLGVTTVTCSARDDAGNERAVSFAVTVLDLSVPVIDAAPDLVVDAVAGSEPAVSYAVTATDNVDGSIGTACDVPSGSLFPVGATAVTCVATDAAGNAAAVTFTVVVNPPPPTATPLPAATATTVPTATDVPAATKTPRPNATAVPTDEADAVPTDVPADREATSTPRPTKTPRATGTPEPTATPTAPVVPTATRVSTPPALALSGPPPESFTLVGDGGPLGDLAMIWENGDYPISQEFGHTWFSVRHGGWYAYGRSYGLDGFEHTGLDIGMPRGTAIHSPVSGTVMVAGGTPYFTFYGNGQPGVGELLIRTDDGDEVVLGHMGLITVQVGQRVEFGQFVGLSGGDNGDHLHLETRDVQPGGGLRIVDPRRSFLVAAIAEADAAANGDAARRKAVASGRRSDADRSDADRPGPDEDPNTGTPTPSATAEDPIAPR